MSQPISHNMKFVFVVDARKTEARSHAHKMGILSYLYKSIGMCFRMIKRKPATGNVFASKFSLNLLALTLYVREMLPFFCYSSAILAHVRTSHIYLLTKLMLI